MNETTTPTNKTRGRPRGFDNDQALEQAMQVFWARGYEGASMAELTAALGINKPSLYAAFGNKEELFRKALEKYMQGPVSYVAEAMEAPTSRKVVEKFLSGSAKFLTGKHHPHGCMIVQGALTVGQGAEMIQQELARYRQSYENKLRKRFKLAREHGEFPKDTDTSALAKYVATVHQGMSVQATSGATREELMEVVDWVLKTWPGR
jgi:AcrR family transcriptional regulator